MILTSKPRRAQRHRDGDQGRVGESREVDQGCISADSSFPQILESYSPRRRSPSVVDQTDCRSMHPQMRSPFIPSPSTSIQPGSLLGEETLSSIVIHRSIPDWFPRAHPYSQQTPIDLPILIIVSILFPMKLAFVWSKGAALFQVFCTTNDKAGLRIRRVVVNRLRYAWELPLAACIRDRTGG